MTTLQDLGAEISARLEGRKRLIVAIVGSPGSGKSTLVDALAADLGLSAAVLPMDGYHLDNAVLDARGLRTRKGAPQTFDVQGLARDLARVRADIGEVLVPVFDRVLDLSRGAARVIAPSARVVLVEGNYLLLDQTPWSGLREYFDLTVALDVPDAILEVRLIKRWLDHGHDHNAAKARALGNDMPNALLVQSQSTTADFVLRL